VKIAAIDVGLKRIGLALAIDKTVLLQKPIMRKNRNQAANEVSLFLKENSVEKLVVGLPKGGKSEDEMQRRIKHFTSLIDFDGEINYVDEYGSSFEAKQMSKGVFKHKKDGKIDSLSATIILQRYLDS